MMENREYLNKLFDIYKELLTNIEQDTFINYYIEDLSLSEIAENRGISKSSVGKTLNGVEEKLKNYEKVLKIETMKSDILKSLDISDIDTLKEKIINILSN